MSRARPQAASSRSMAEVGGVPQDTDRGAEALLRMRSLAQDDLDQRRCLRPDLASPVAGCVPASSRHSAGGWTAYVRALSCDGGWMTSAHGRRRDCLDGKARWSAR